MIVVMSASMMMVMFVSCLIVLFIILKRRGAIGSSGASASSSSIASLASVPSGNSTLNIAPRANYKSGELVSSTVADVPGLRKTGGPATMYTGEHAQINPPAGAPTSAAALRRVNRVFTYADAKKMMAHSVQDAWPAIKKYFSVEDWQMSRFVALMLGQATRESTLAVDIETGKAKGYNKDSAHAYGLLQTAVTGFQGANPSYDQEADVPEMRWYAFTPENFYNAMISNFVGLRKMCHFALQAKTKYKVTDKWQVLRLALQAHNTGHANPGNDDNYMATYPDLCARMGEYYFVKKHMADDVYTWTGNHSGFPTSYPEPARGTAWRSNWSWFWTK